jgi:amidase
MHQATVSDLPFDPTHYRALCEINQIAMRFEAARIHREVFEQSLGLLGASTLSMITEGLKIPASVYDQAMVKRAQARQAFAQSMAGVDVAITLSSPGEAPLFTEGTGNSTFNQAWTTLGVPCITLPAGKGVKGLPLGIQLVAAQGQDYKLLEVAKHFSAALEQR